MPGLDDAIALPGMVGPRPTDPRLDAFDHEPWFETPGSAERAGAPSTMALDCHGVVTLMTFKPMR
jgi:hypothetical protein